MNKIKFSHEWDKLNDPAFTTIRSWNEEKEAYYLSCIGQEFSVWKIKNGYSFKPEYVICHAYLVDVKHVKTKDIDKATLEKDVLLNGKPHEGWMAMIMKNDTVLLLLFSRDPLLPFQVETQRFFEILSESHRKVSQQSTLEEMEALK